MPTSEKPHKHAAKSAPAVEPVAREGRRRLIASLVQAQRIESQWDLQALLQERGIEVNQATLSRDLRTMGVLKGPHGYQLPDSIALRDVDESLALYSAVQNWLSSAVSAENLVVLKTPIGGAQPLAIAIDKAGWPEVLGTIGGDDTILVVVKSAADARRIVKALLELRERRKK